MSVLLIVVPKCTLAASHAVSHGEYADGRDGRKDDRQAVTLRFPLDGLRNFNTYTRRSLASCVNFGIKIVPNPTNPTPKPRVNPTQTRVHLWAQETCYAWST